MKYERKLNEECGVFGIYGHDDAANMCYYGLHSLQHRGQEACGIISKDKDNFYVHKQEGLVNEVFTVENLERLKGDCAIGHVRYSTFGGGGISNVQPFLFNTLKYSLAIAHNGNITNANELRDKLEQKGSIFFSSSDTEILGHLLVRENGSFVDRIKKSLAQLKGSFSFLIMFKDCIYGIRDKHGLRPLSLGSLPNGGYVLTSETCSFDVIGAKFIRDIEPGEIIQIKDNKIESYSYVLEPKYQMCAMEYVYFSRPDSNIEGINVHAVRKECGKILFEEASVIADLVIGVPDSSISASIGYSEASKIPYEIGLIKNKYIGRTFIQPTQKLREQGVKMKLSAISSIVKDKRVVLVDDSIVRGTTSKRIIVLLKEAGAKEVHVRIASPAIKFPCFYGVDISKKEELISNYYDTEQLCQFIGADSLAFISLNGLKKAINKFNPKLDVCTACFDGNYID